MKSFRARSHIIFLSKKIATERIVRGWRELFRMAAINAPLPSFRGMDGQRPAGFRKFGREELATTVRLIAGNGRLFAGVFHPLRAIKVIFMDACTPLIQQPSPAAWRPKRGGIKFSALGPPPVNKRVQCSRIDPMDRRFAKLFIQNKAVVNINKVIDTTVPVRSYSRHHNPKNP